MGGRIRMEGLVVVLLIDLILVCVRCDLCLGIGIDIGIERSPAEAPSASSTSNEDQSDGRQHDQYGQHETNDLTDTDAARFVDRCIALRSQKHSVILRTESVRGTQCVGTGQILQRETGNGQRYIVPIVSQWFWDRDGKAPILRTLMVIDAINVPEHCRWWVRDDGHRGHTGTPHLQTVYDLILEGLWLEIHIQNQIGQ
uniref:Putative secreted protein n=1 Tax=Anopheles darlingi TaxID=43151 RepID=A0A2M4D672_ANODA